MEAPRRTDDTVEGSQQSMIGIVLSVIVAVLAATSAVFSIASYLNRSSFPHSHSRGGRARFTATLLLVSIIAGWHAIDEARARLPATGRGEHPQRVGTDAPTATQGRGMATHPTSSDSQDRMQETTPRTSGARPRENITRNTTTPRIRIQDDSGKLVPRLVLIAQREVPANLMVEGTLHMTTTPPDDALQGLITANATLSVNTTSGERLVDAFDLDTRGGGFTAQAAIRQALERLEAELTKRLKEHA
jgi:hypothetical protein